MTAADDGIHTTGDITLAGGDITISAGDDGIHSDASVLISDGTLLINECYEGIEALIIDVSGGDVTIYPQDDGFNANGNSDSQIGGGMGGGAMGGAHMGATGEMQAPPEMGSADSTGANNEMPTPPEMGSADSTGANNGMQAPPEMRSAETNSTAANDEETYISISGGTITIINETGNDADGLDSNGDILISGGTIYISLQGSGSNSAVDYASENGGVAEITGGTIIACGASSMAEAFDSSSTQASILYNTSTVTDAGTTLSIEDADDNELLSWEVPCSFSSALVSCPQMETGGTYTVVIGENKEEITLDEVSASYGNAQSSMFGGNMNWGGMQPRSGGQRNGDPRGNSSEENASTSGTDTAAAAFPESMGSPGGKGGGPAGNSFGENASTSGTDTAAAPSMEKMQGGSNAGSMQDQSREQTQEEEDQTAATFQSTAEPVDTQTWAVLGGCLALLFAGLAVGKIYKRH